MSEKKYPDTAAVHQQQRQQQQQPQRVGRSGEGALSVLEHLLKHERAKAEDNQRPPGSSDRSR